MSLLFCLIHKIRSLIVGTLHKYVTTKIQQTQLQWVPIISVSRIARYCISTLCRYNIAIGALPITVQQGR
jgi:hypothetical protein